MHRIPVQSSDLVSVGYDDSAQTLEIEFKEGRIYQYFEVPRDIHKGLLRAESPGTYFFSHINAYFRYRRVSEQSRFNFTSSRTVTFVTGNQRKLRSMQQICVPRGITVKHQDFEIVEIQSHDPSRIAEHKAEEAFKRSGGIPTVINDEFWAIPSLKGFPGGYMKDVYQWFEAEDFIHLMQNKADRSIILTQTTIFKDKDLTKTFTKEIRGVITDAPRGKGASFERVVVLDNSDKTLAECQEAGLMAIEPKDNLWNEFADWFIGRTHSGSSR